MNTMSRTLAVALAVALAAPAPGWSMSGEVTVGAEVFSGDQDNAKFREYRYRTDDPVGATISLDLEAEPSESRFYELGLKARTAEDVDLEVETGSYGKYRAKLGFQRLGHNFAFGAKTIFAGAGTDLLTVDDGIQAFMHNTATTPVTTIPGKLRSTVDAATPIDLWLKRDRASLDLAWDVAKPVTVNVEANYEKRKGTRPIFGTFGFGNALELAEPIDYDTSRFREGVDYHAGSFHASLEHELSVFSNSFHTLTYDNPFRNVDGTVSSAYQLNTRSGPRIGRQALPPDNMANHVTASVAQKLPWHSRVSGGASFGWLRQDDKLAPVTTNSAVAGFPLSSPRETAEAAVDTRLYTMQLTSRPLKKLHLKASGRYDQHDNNTPAYTINSWVVADANLYAGGAATSHYVSVVKRLAEVEAAYDIMKQTTLSLAYEKEHANFDNGSALKEDENIYKLALDTRRIKATELRLALEHSNKNSDYPDYTAMELPWMRKYYAASRDRNSAMVMASVFPSDKFSAGVEYTFGVDDYPASEFGLRYSRSHTASVDAEYQLTERISIGPSYTFEYYKTHQKNRQWTPAGAGDPYTAAYSGFETFGNWTVDYIDVIHTPALNLGIVVVPDKLDFTATGSAAMSDNKRDYESAVGTTANDNNAFVPQDDENADDNYLISVNAKFDYAVKKDVSVALGYLYQRWNVQDNFLYDGYQRMALTGAGGYNGLLSMDTLYKPYNVHALYVQGTYRF